MITYYIWKVFIEEYEDYLDILIPTLLSIVFIPIDIITSPIQILAKIIQLILKKKGKIK